MIIAIDGNEANVRQRVGIGQYAYQVLRHMRDYASDNIRFRILLKNPPLSDMPGQSADWKYAVFGPKKLWTQIALPIHLYKTKPSPDVIFSPSHYAPRFSPCPSVISIMDLSYIHYPEMFTKRDLYQLREWTGYSVKHAKYIFTISEYSKQTIADYYGVTSDRVIVTYPGYRDDIFNMNETDDDKVREKYDLGRGYVLYVGTIQPRKNIIRLIDAFGVVAGKRDGLQLVIAGKKGWMYEQIFQYMNNSGLGSRMKYLEFVPEEHLPSLFRQARCFVLPSLYEGFGIPVIEAMACGIPVVSSNNTSLPEVTGNAGIFVNPLSVKEIADAIDTACYNSRERREMIRKGLEQVKKFSWQKCTDKTFNTLTALRRK